jgi:hypothetical protein
VGSDWLIAGVNTYGGSFAVAGAPASPLFGSAGGGMIVSTYTAWIDSITSPIPEPASLLLFLTGLAGLGGRTLIRRRNGDR